MKENLTPFEDVLLKEATPHLLTEYIKEYQANLSLEFRLVVPDYLSRIQQNVEVTELFKKMQARKDFLLADITTHDISEKAKKMCMKGRLRTIKDVCSKTRMEVWNRVNRTTLGELEDLLKFFGLWFKDEKPYHPYFSTEELLQRYKNIAQADILEIYSYLPENVAKFCYKAKIKKVEELCSKSEEDILQYDGCGPKTALAIRAFLREIGLSRNSKFTETDAGSAEKKVDVQAFQISDFNVPVRVQTVCNLGGIKTIGDLVTHSRLDLLKIPHCGRKTINDIEDLLESLNLTLREDS